MEHFFSPNSSTDVRSDAHQSQIIGGNADEDHILKLLGGIQSNYSGDIYRSPPGFRHPCPQKVPFLKIFDDVIACDLWFGTPLIQYPGYAYACSQRWAAQVIKVAPQALAQLL